MINHDYDIIVIGGGVSGCSAALSARRENRKVLLIEKNPLLGGLATSGLINWFEPLCDGKENQLIYSQCEEFFKLAQKYNFKDDKSPNSKRKASWFNHNVFALSLNKLLLKEGVDIFYESLVSDLKLKDDQIDSIEVSNVEGKIWLKAKQYIDASGSALLFRKAGLKVREGKNYLVYVTTTYQKGIDKPVFQYTGGLVDGTNHPKGEKLFSGIKQDDVNAFIQKGQLYCLDEYESGKLKDISSLPSIPQFRKIASIEGEYCLSDKDLLVHHDDSIGVFGSYHKIGDIYEIPMGCLYSKKINNLYAAGRIISSDEDGWETTRVIPVCILTGEVAGVMASLAIDDKLNIKEVQNKLLLRGNKIHY